MDANVDMDMMVETPAHKGLSQPHNTSSAPKKRKMIDIACTACQKRKSKCDGHRPQCNMCVRKASKCHYPADLRRNSSLRELNIKLMAEVHEYEKMADSLRSGNPAEVQKVLQSLRGQGKDASKCASDKPPPPSFTRKAWLQEQQQQQHHVGSRRHSMTANLSTASPASPMHAPFLIPNHQSQQPSPRQQLFQHQHQHHQAHQSEMEQYDGLKQYKHQRVFSLPLSEVGLPENPLASPWSDGDVMCVDSTLIPHMDSLTNLCMAPPDGSPVLTDYNSLGSSPSYFEDVPANSGQSDQLSVQPMPVGPCTRGLIMHNNITTEDNLLSLATILPLSYSYQNPEGDDFENTLTSVFRSFQLNQRALMSRGAPILQVLGSHTVNASALLSKQQLGASDPVSAFVARVVQSYGSDDLTKLGYMHLRHRMMRWLIKPCEEIWEQLPTCMRPTPAQYLVPHPLWVDFIIHPDVRDMFILSPSSRQTLWYNEIPNIRLEWTRPVGEAVIVDENGILRPSISFQEHANCPQAWSLPADVLVKLPSLSNIICTRRPGDQPFRRLQQVNHAPA